MAGFLTMEAKGVAKDCHENFPIRFDYSETNGTAFFIGCRVHAEVELNNGQVIDKRMDIRAFGDVAEELASVTEGTEIHVKGDYGQTKGKDGKYYPILTVTEVLSLD